MSDFLTSIPEEFDLIFFGLSLLFIALYPSIYLNNIEEIEENEKYENNI